MAESLSVERQLEAYLKVAGRASLPGWRSGLPFSLDLLSESHRNWNFMVAQGFRSWLVRVKKASGPENRSGAYYEYRVLRLVSALHDSPRVFYVDTSKDKFGADFLTLEYVAGGPFQPERDSGKVGNLFGRLHGLEVGDAGGFLEEDASSLTDTLDYAEKRLSTTPILRRLDPSIRSYLVDLLAWASEEVEKNAYFDADPYEVVLHRVSRPSDIVIQRATEKAFLLDWEDSAVGEPSRDLAFFLSPLVTYWDSGFVFSRREISEFFAAYRDALKDAHLGDTITDRVRLRAPFVNLGVLAWLISQALPDAILRRETMEVQTLRRLADLLNLTFLRQVFDPYLEGRA